MQSVLSSVLMGLHSLRSNRLRTTLSTLGVVIGVAAVVAILAVGDGVEHLARERVGSTTALQTVMVSPLTSRHLDGHRVPVDDWPRFTAGDRDSLLERLPAGCRVKISLEGSALFTDLAGEERALTLAGVADDSDETAVAAGRGLRSDELRGRDPAVVVSMGLAAALGAASDPDSLVGTILTLGEARYEVVGVAEGAPDGPLRATVPLETAEAGCLPRREPRARTLAIEAPSVEAVDAVRAAVESWLAVRVGADWTDRAEVVLNRYRLAQVQQAFLIFKLLMGSVAGISLITGGIGIMNVLLAGVLERTREIGVRKAAGARRRDIAAQFLAEAVAITGAGCVLGLLLGLAAAYGITAVMRAQTEAVVAAAVTWPTVLVALGLAVLVGVGFGLYPALRASRLSPIEAIRHE